MNDRDFQMYLNFEQYRVADRFFESLDPEILQTLTPTQKKDISRALVRSFLSPSQKCVDLRWSFPFIRKRRYLQVLIGSDMRDGETRYYNRYLSRSRWISNILFIVAIVCLLVCAGVGAEHVLASIF